MEGTKIYNLIEARILALRSHQKDYDFQGPLEITINLGRRAGHTTAGSLLLEHHQDAIMLVQTQDLKQRLRGFPFWDRVLTYHEALEQFRGNKMPDLAVMDDFSMAVLNSGLLVALGRMARRPGFVEVRLG
jgi:hypothetical protein